MPKSLLSRLRAALTCAALAVSLAATPVAAQAQTLNCTGHDSFDAGLIAQAQQRAAGGVSLQNISTTGELGLSTTGKARFVVVRVSFPAAEDGSEAAMNFDGCLGTLDDVRAAFNGGDGALNAECPLESLNAYYDRASYGKLDAQAAYVLDYTARYNRSHYTGDVTELFYEALAGIDDQVDFAQCDANNDGKIDGIYLQFAGRPTGWGTTWWPTMRTLTSDEGHVYDGKVARGAVLLESQVASANEFCGTIVHETGHVLGLPDLYHYSDASLGILCLDMMYNNRGDIDGLCKWMLDWIDAESITYVYVSKDGVDVRRGSGDIKHYDDAAEEVLAAYSDGGDVSKTGGFMAVSTDESILEGNLFTNFYLVEYRERTANDTVTLGDTSMGRGFRVYRVQAAYNQDRGFEHSNTVGGAHAQLIEALRPATSSEGAAALFALWQKDMSITPATSPSTNMGENVLTGYTGIAFEVVDSGEGSGRIRIGYQKAPEQSELNAELSESSVNGTCGVYTFALSRDVLNNDWEMPVKAKIVVDGVEYDAANWSVDTASRTLKAYVKLEAGIIKSASKVQIKLPARAFVLSLDSSGLPNAWSDELTVDVPVPAVCDIEGTGAYDAASVELNGMRKISDVFEAGGSRYFFVYTFSFDTASERLALYRLSSDGKSCERVPLDGMPELGVGSATGIEVVPYGDGRVFVRVSRAATDSSVAVANDVAVDVTAGRVLAVRGDVTPAELAEGARLVPFGESVACALKLADESWAIMAYKIEDGAITSTTSVWSGADARVTARFVDAGEGYTAAVMSNYGGGTGRVLLWRTSDLVGADSLTSVVPAVTLEMADNYGISSVRVAGGHVYVLVTSDHKNGEQDHFVNELLVFDFSGNVVSTHEVANALLFFGNEVDMRVSSAGSVALSFLDSNESVTLGVRRRQVLFDGDMTSKGEVTCYEDSVGAWLGERWISLDWGVMLDYGDLPDTLQVRWALTAPVGSADPVNPDGPSDPVDPSDPSVPSAPSSTGSKATAATSARRAGSLANTGDRTVALVAGVLAAGLALVIAGILIYRKRR